jgi:hypothetical protein
LLPWPTVSRATSRHPHSRRTSAIIAGQPGIFRDDVTLQVRTAARRKLIGLLLLGLAVRIVMPAGYMPAPIGEGGPFVPCPGGLSGALFLVDHGSGSGTHHSHGTGDAADADASTDVWEFCPFGAVFGSAVLVNDSYSALPVVQQGAPPAHRRLPVSLPELRPFHARAPPLLGPLQA